MTWTEYVDVDRTTWPPPGSYVQFLRGDNDLWICLTGEIHWDRYADGRPGFIGTAMSEALVVPMPEDITDRPDMPAGTDNRFWRLTERPT